MANSCSISSVANLRADQQPCKKCGRSTNVLVSSSVKNPGRPFNCCPDHGFSHWVFPGPNLRDSEAVAVVRQRGGRSSSEEMGTGNGQPMYGDVQKFREATPICHCNNLVWALTFINVISIITNMISLLINTFKK